MASLSLPQPPWGTSNLQTNTAAGNNKEIMAANQTVDSADDDASAVALQSPLCLYLQQPSHDDATSALLNLAQNINQHHSPGAFPAALFRPEWCRTIY